MVKYKGYRIFWVDYMNAYAVLPEKENRTIGYASTIEAAKRCIDEQIMKKRRFHEYLL